MKFITICDKGSDKTNNLIESLSGNVICIDYDKEIGDLSKIFNFYKYLTLYSDIPNNEIIVYIDGFDVICIKTEGLEKEFIKSGKDIIYGAEGEGWHQKKEVLEWFENKYRSHKLRYINCGFCIGYYRSLIKMFSHIVKNFNVLYNFPNNYTDQKIISFFMMKKAQSLNIKMDIDPGSIFCTTIAAYQKNYTIESIASYFIHFTWLANPIQKNRYNEAVTYFLKGKK